MNTKFLEKIALVIASAAKQSMTAILATATAACLLLFAGCEAQTKGKYQPDETETPGNGNGDDPTTEVRYRGIGINQEAITEADFRRMADWGVNHVRWNFENWNDLSSQTVEEYYAWISNQCDRLEAALPVLAAQGITVTLDIHHPLRGNDGNYTMMIFKQKALQEAFVEGWRRIAERFKDNNTIVYYDLLNEPATSAVDPACKSWPNLAVEIIDSINVIDNTKKFIFELMDDRYRNFTALPRSNVVYSIHMYTPHLLTHQGVGTAKYPDASYPANITGDIFNWADAPDYWDKATLRRFLDESCGIIDFARNNNVEIYVGEFGCARWAPNHSAYEYLRDCLELFEEYGWHWVYFNDGPKATTNIAANTWSLQYNEVYGSTQPESEPTDRLELLQSYWAKNGK